MLECCVETLITVSCFEKKFNYYCCLVSNRCEAVCTVGPAQVFFKAVLQKEYF